MIKLYGIKNCNTVKKAVDWLTENKVNFQFHDYKKEGVDVKKLEEFVAKNGLEKLINKKGTTWKQLTAEQQNQANDKKLAIKLMQEKPSVIKRPILDLGQKQLFGFDEKEYKELL